MQKKLTILIPLLFTTFLTFGQMLRDTLRDSNIDRIVAKVDNYIILRSEVEQIVIRSQQDKQVGAITKCQALEQLIIQKMLVAKAEIDSVIVEDKQIQSTLEAKMKEMVRVYGSEKNIVEQFGKSLETLKSEVRSTLKEQLSAQKMQGEITKNIKNPTPNDVKKFFMALPQDSLPLLPADVEISQIVRFAKVTKLQKADLIQKLLGFKKRVIAGEKFDDLAKEFSEDVGSRPTGGDLGWAKRGQMVPPFEAAAMKLKAGEMSEVVESDFGFHLIYQIDIRGQEYHAKHILLRPDYSRLDLTEPTHYLDSLRQEIKKDSIKFDKAAKEYTEDKNTQETYGSLLNPQTGTTRLALDQSMEPTLYFTIDSMQVGTITAPLPYRSEDGKTGVRLLYYKKKYPPHTISLQYDYQNIAEIVLANKRNKAVDEWFRNSVKDVYIKIDPEFEICDIFGKTRNTGN
jgi:peptidyl-prolyl cis-trans isomerase SurA